MKILFLDIDGVLNYEASFRRWWAQYGNNKCIDRGNVEVLNAICEEHPDLNIVLSSTWRLYFSIPEMREQLVAQGFLFPERLIDRTRSARRDEPRGFEIRDWLAERDDVTAFVILDDYSDMKPHMGHLVQTSDKHGLEHSHIRAVNRVLQRPWPVKIITEEKND